MEYQGERRQIPPGEFIQRNYRVQARFPDGQGVHSVGNIGAGDQRTAALLRENDSNDMDTSEDVSVFSGPAYGVFTKTDTDKDFDCPHRS